MKKILISLFVLVVVGYFIYKIIIDTPPPGHGTNLITATMAQPADEKASEMPKHASIYIDASGSMKPYFTCSDENIINTVSKLKNLDDSNSEIFFLGDKISRKGLVMQILGDIKKQPNNVATTFHDFFREKAASLDTTSTVCYLVTDGIMSVGKKVGATKLALEELEGKIKSALMPYSSTMAAAIFRYNGKYEGNYWHHNDSVSQYNGSRPFYVIAIGQKPYIKWLASLKEDELNNPEGKLFMGLHSPKGHTQTNVFSKTPSDTIIDPLKDVTLTVELPQCLGTLPTDPYVENNGYHLSIKTIKDDRTLKVIIPANTPGFYADNRGHYETKIVVPNSIPGQWNEWSVENDLGNVDPSTTFGLINLTRGIFNAFEPNDTLLAATFEYTLN